jgi:DNA-binding XRE family transcriptional regulator
MTTKSQRLALDVRRVELDGICYVILREPVFDYLCEQAGVKPQPAPSDGEPVPGFDLDRATLAAKLVRRRQAAGLSQAELARRAGVRPETLNRIENGHTTPDFATVRKLVEAMNAAERARLVPAISHPNCEEPNHAEEPSHADVEEAL